jgi:hypothetical protein
VALLLFAVLSATSWFVSVALYRSLFVGHDPAETSGYSRIAAVAIGAASLIGFIPFPTGYLLAILAGAVAVFGFLQLPRGRSAALVGLLALTSFVVRLAVLGALELF